MVHKITVVGAGVSGRALALWAASRGAGVFVTDHRAEIPRETQELFSKTRIQWETGGHTPRCCECDLMVVSSGVSEKSDAVSMAHACAGRARPSRPVPERKDHRRDGNERQNDLHGADRSSAAERRTERRFGGEHRQSPGGPCGQKL